MTRRLIFSFVTVALALMMSLAVGEAVLRVLYLLKPTSGAITNLSMYLDEELGWRYFPLARSNVTGRLLPADKPSSQSVAMVQQFQISGDARKRKVLVIGDSFTMAAGIPSDETYYGVLEQRFPIEVFAYGAGGYGSLQEFMILDRVIDVVQPSLIIWQYCSNDFINNSYELESRSYLNNNGLRRPYLSDTGEIVYAVPSRLSWLRSTGSQYSKLIYFVFSRVDKLRAALIQTSLGQTLLGPTVEQEIAVEGKRHRGFQAASSITRQIMKRVRQRSKQIPIVAFSVDDPAPYYEEFQQISLSSGILFVDGVPQAVREAENEGLQTRTADKAHWDRHGHRIGGEVIAAYLARHYFSGQNHGFMAVSTLEASR